MTKNLLSLLRQIFIEFLLDFTKKTTIWETLRKEASPNFLFY